MCDREQKDGYELIDLRSGSAYVGWSHTGNAGAAPPPPAEKSLLGPDGKPIVKEKTFGFTA